MERHLPNHKKQLILSLSALLVVGFLTTSLVSYFVSRSSLRTQIASTALPLTSDNIYSEIQSDLLRPILISSLMANDTFFRNWILEGENDEGQIRKYLNEIKVKYETFTSFFVSERTRIYYHADGILKKVKPEEERDKWYFRLQQMEADYETNVDPDMANQDEMTIFINHKVYDYEGNYIGATGVGLTTGSVVALIDDYLKKFNRNVYFVDHKGAILLRGSSFNLNTDNIRGIDGMSSIADEILSADESALKYSRRGKVVYLHTRFISQLNWYMLVEQTEEGAIEDIHSALMLNLMFCALITVVAIILTTVTINVYQRINEGQQEEILEHHRELLEHHAELEKALGEVRKLSGFLPICSSCKKIRDDKGYWQQIESYICDHSEADFSHGICPQCSQKLYPEISNDTKSRTKLDDFLDI